MATLAQTLGAEIKRLAKKEAKSLLKDVQETNKKLRQTITSLNKRLTHLERASKKLVRAEKKRAQEPPQIDEEELDRVRITSKGVRSLRRKWGVSQANFGKILGVSTQTIVNWESQEGALNMREAAKTAYVACRSMGAREAAQRLEDLEGKKG